ncbi:hypothetical protein pb186bvf_007657 [Paramecium bursaria]
MIIHSIQINHQSLYASDNYGFLYIWEIEKILQQHLKRQHEISQNNFIYNHTVKKQLSQYPIEEILIDEDNLYFTTNGMLKIIKVPQLEQIQDIKLHNNNKHIKIGFQNDLVVAQGLFIQVMDQNTDKLIPYDISSINNTIESLVPLEQQEISTILCFNRQKVGFGTNLGLVCVWDQKRKVLETIFKQTEQLSPVLGLQYMEDSCVLASLHQGFIYFWNTIIEQQIQKFDVNAICMTIKDGGIFVAGDTRKINDIQKTKELNCSQDIVLKLTTFEDLMITRQL